MHFRVFSKGQGTKWGIFLRLLKFSIVCGCLKFQIYLGGGGERKMLGPSLCMK